MHMEKLKLKSSTYKENGHLSFERDYGVVYGFSWPQRNYKCTFCAKEFKSAQALGGHMNVHRRDRAKLRLSPSNWESPNPNPNFSTPNSSSLSSSSTSSTTVRFVPYPPNLCQCSIISSRDEERVPVIAQHAASNFMGLMLGDSTMDKKVSMGMGSEVGELKDFLQVNGGDWKSRIETEVGLARAAKEEVDLELRLGLQSNY